MDVADLQRVGGRVIDVRLVLRVEHRVHLVAHYYHVVAPPAHGERAVRSVQDAHVRRRADVEQALHAQALAVDPLVSIWVSAIAARWNRLGEAVKTRKKRDKTGEKWARYGLKRVNKERKGGITWEGDVFHVHLRLT